MRIEVKQLGLAAYVKMKGSELINVDENIFIFESDKSITEWRVEYTNSCCSRHDSELCELRKFITPVHKNNN